MTVTRKRVLFICIHNSARSQIAEAYLKQIAGDRFEVESAGLEPGKLNPLAVKAMREHRDRHQPKHDPVGFRPLQERQTLSVRDQRLRRRVGRALSDFPGRHDAG